ncbi:unnamed protein product [Arctogadus glacialis]
MAAAQCRSSKCTAERKGFRRELDSWRHKLIHCVGVESILEGIYGPMLLRDLNIFDDCEPKESDDWSVEASYSHCSFCTLPLDQLSDLPPAAASPLHSPSDYSPCQAPTLSESSQSAQQFLQAVFHKKDVPHGYDSNVPLAAQELMKKMIHKFAIEYASKSHVHMTMNGLTTDNLSPQPTPGDLDAPLDLTVPREKEEDGEPGPDAVLDLSKRTSVCSAAPVTADNKSSGLPLKEELGGPEKLMTEGGQVNENSAFEKVLNSLCPAHRSLISQILMLARQEQLLSLPNPRLADQDASKCCHHSLTSQNNLPPCCFPLSNSKSLSGAPHYPLVDCAHQGCSKTLYSPAESMFSCTLRCCPLSESKASQGPCCCIESSYPVSCHENLLCTSCQHLTGHQTKNHCSSSSSPSLCPSSQVCPASSICCNSHFPVSCLCHSSHTCLAQTRQTMEKEGEDVDPPCPVLKREHSPSPPPLSPIPPDITSIAEEKPPLLPLYCHDEHLPLVDNQHLDARLQGAPSDIEDAAELNGVAAGGQTQKNSNRSLLRDVVDRFTEKLETIRPQDKDPPQLSSSTEDGIEKEGAPSSPSPQSIPFHADAHLSEIITTVLHTGSDSDYNLSELFHQHDNKEAKSPNTRARRRQEVLASLTLPANLASSRRHSLKIKRELAMLDPSYCRRKVPQAKRKLKDGSNSSSPVSSSSDTTPVKEATRESGIQENEMVQISGKLSVESGNFGDSSKEIGRMTGKTKGKVTDYTRNDGLESPVFEQRRVEVNTIKAEEDGFEVKEDIQTIIVKEEIETIEVGQNVPAIEEEKASFQQTLKPPCELQTKPCRVVSEGNYQSCAERHTIVGNHLENEENIEESDKRLTRSRGLGGRRKTIAPYQSSKSRDATRSKRNIVPPQRFSSYVTEPRKMYFVACFSENIFNPRTLVDSVGQSTTSIDSQNLDLMDPLLDSGKTPSQAAHSTEPTGAEDDLTPKVLTGSSNADQSQGFSVSLRPTRLSPSKYSSKNKTDVRDSAARPYGRLRSSSTKPHALESVTVCRTPAPKSSPSFSYVDTPPNPSELPFEFSSPIKIMYVSPVINEEGVKYCLKSAASSSGGQVVHNFDPCEQSSWAGTPGTSHGTERAIFQIGSNSAPLKNATSSPKSASPSPKKVSTPLKSPSTPLLSGSPTLRSASSPTKVVSVSPKGSRRSGELTPLKRVARTENQRSPADLGSSHEITPTPKRRPGRPKKLGPRLEQKAKRPIGRPRKQTTTGPIQEGNADVVKAIEGANMEKENKNLKITVVYGRSRRNKRVVSEGQGQQELCETAQSVERNIDFRNLLHGTQEHSDVVKAASPECLKELNLVRPVNDESAPPASSNIKCQKLQGAISIRKPGRPAKVKISGISVTVTTVSPRQRKIQMDKDVKRSQETLQSRKTLLPEFNYIKETWNSDCPSRNECRHKEGKGVTKDEGKAKRLDRPVAVRHSVRVRKPSIYLLHSVATSSSRSYSHSTALIRSSRKLLLNKAINQRKLEKAQDCLENLKDKRQSLGREKNPIRQDLSQVAAVSVDSIFPPQETMKWWAASAEKKDLNQEFARRIQLVSDTWVSDIDNQQKCSLKPRSGPPSKRSRCSSVVRALFDCPPNKPSSCSMQQLGSWFMQTTETKPLAIVKKASSRNPYEFMHYPRSTNNNEGVCPSPQAERLRKHIKKFAKTVPKSPLAHRLALERLRNGNKTLSAGNIKRQLFTSRFAPGRLNKGAPWWMGRTVSKYATTLLRAKARFLTCLQRNGLPKRQRKDWWPSVTAQKQRDKALSRLSPAHQDLDGSEKGSADPLPKEDSLSSKAWSPEKLKECRVFLKKINSPVSESTAEEELDSCKVTLDDWSPSAYRFAGSEGGLARENEAVKTERKAKLKAGSNSDESSSSVSKSPQEQAEVQTGQKEEQNAPVIVSTGAPQPASVKMLRQSRKIN